MSYENINHHAVVITPFPFYKPYCDAIERPKSQLAEYARARAQRVRGTSSSSSSWGFSFPSLPSSTESTAASAVDCSAAEFLTAPCSGLVFPGAEFEEAEAVDTSFLFALGSFALLFAFFLCFLLRGVSPASPLLRLVCVLGSSGCTAVLAGVILTFCDDSGDAGFGASHQGPTAGRVGVPMGDGSTRDGRREPPKSKLETLSAGSVDVPWDLVLTSLVCTIASEVSIVGRGNGDVPLETGCPPRVWVATSQRPLVLASLGSV